MRCIENVNARERPDQFDRSDISQYNLTTEQRGAFSIAGVSL